MNYIFGRSEFEYVDAIIRLSEVLERYRPSGHLALIKNRLSIGPDHMPQKVDAPSMIQVW